MDITDSITSNMSTTDVIEPEVQRILQNDEGQTENIMSDLPSTDQLHMEENIFGQKKIRFLLFWPNGQRIKRIPY